MKLLYYTKDYEYLAKDLAAREENEFTLVDIERDRFPDGEFYLRNPQHVKGAHCVILGGTQTLENIFEIMNIGYQITTNGAKKLTIMIPYYGYSTMERSTKSGEVVMAKTMAHWLSSIPRASFGNEILMLDLHTDAICHYFDSSVTTKAIAGTEIIMRACIEMAGTRFVLGSTDVGRAKTIEYLQRAFTAKGRGYQVETAFVYKRRSVDNHEAGNTEVTGINADVSGKSVVIYDDMIRTGGSLLKAAKIYKEAGATEVYAVSTHGVMPGDTCMKLYSSGLIKLMAITNSHPQSQKINADTGSFVRVYSIAGLISKFI